VVTEMRQDPGKIDAGYPFPCMLMLPRSAPFRCSKRKDPASIFGQTRRADHDLTRTFTVFANGIRESRPAYLLNQAKQSAASDRAPEPIIPGFADFVTALLNDLSIPVGRAEMFMVGE
jgi:hypothetical protein